MKKAWFVLRSALLWMVSGLHFFLVVPVLLFLGIFLDARRHDWLQRSLCRRIAFLSGAKVEVRRPPGFDPQRTSFFFSNHVNLFDPFMLYCAIPQFVRGWELESHFKIPAYGWLMKRFGNVPVPDVRRPSDLKRMWRLTQEAIDSGTSLVIFPEARRTRDGHVNEFQEAASGSRNSLAFLSCRSAWWARSSIIAPGTGCSGREKSPSIYTTQSKRKVCTRKRCPPSGTACGRLLPDRSKPL